LTYARSGAPVLPLAITVIVIAAAIYLLPRMQTRDASEADRAGD
jgi:hypothetical protein